MNRKKILVLQSFGWSPPHLSTEMELIEQHADQGDSVCVASCRGRLLSCRQNVDHDYLACKRCIQRHAYGMRLVEGKYRQIQYPPLTEEDRQMIRSARYQFGTTAELRAYHVDNFDVGMAVLSTMISRYRNPEQDPVFDTNLVRRLLYSALATYRSTIHLLNQEQPDLVYFWNGRFAIMRAFVRACERCGVDYQVHERGGGLSRYNLWSNGLPHSRKLNTEQALAHWERGVEPDRTKIAEEFYRARAAGEEWRGLSFTKKQLANTLPASWDETYRNMVMFTSSEDEFAAISDEWGRSPYVDQVDAVRHIQASLIQGGDRIRLYVRMHPNLAGLNDPVTKAMRDMSGSHVEVIAPESPISSYACLMRAEKTLVFRSSMGAEAVFWGKPSIVYGVASYLDLGESFYVPQSHEQLMEMLRATLEPKSKEAAYIRGYFLATHGYPYKHYVPTGYAEGSYRGVALPGDETATGFLCRVGRQSDIARRAINYAWLIRSKYYITRRLRW